MIQIDGVPRRIRLDKMSVAEAKITHAMVAVEELGCDVRLTEAVCLLSDAREKVADVIDERMENCGGQSVENLRPGG